MNYREYFLFYWLFAVANVSLTSEWVISGITDGASWLGLASKNSFRLMKRFLIVLTGPTNIPCHFTNPFSYRKKAKKVKKFPIIVYPSRLLHSQDHIAPIAIFSSPFCCRFSSSGGQDISGSPDICTLAAFCVGQLLLISSCRTSYSYVLAWKWLSFVGISLVGTSIHSPFKRCHWCSYHWMFR